MTTTRFEMCSKGSLKVEHTAQSREDHAASRNGASLLARR